MGNYLIVEDQPRPVEVAFVLGGGVKDRAEKAAALYHDGHCKSIVPLGENYSSVLELLDTIILDAHLSAYYLEKLGVATDALFPIAKGTSTHEEATEIIAYCKANQLKEVMVISSKFHLRRIDSILRDTLEETGIQLVLIGAPSSRYNEVVWWESEQGLIAVNNEYMKLLYYWWKY